jgi:hypothetical protein
MEFLLKCVIQSLRVGIVNLRPDTKNLCHRNVSVKKMPLPPLKLQNHFTLTILALPKTT